MSQTLGDKIRSLLAERQMNQADLVRMTGISKATVSELINNKQKSTSLELSRKIAKALRVSPMYFLEEAQPSQYEMMVTLPDSLRKFVTNKENLEYLFLAKKLKNKHLHPETVEKIICAYEAFVDNGERKVLKWKQKK